MSEQGSISKSTINPETAKQFLNEKKEDHSASHKSVKQSEKAKTPLLSKELNGKEETRLAFKLDKDVEKPAKSSSKHAERQAVKESIKSESKGEKQSQHFEKLEKSQK